MLHPRLKCASSALLLTLMVSTATLPAIASPSPEPATTIQAATPDAGPLEIRGAVSLLSFDTVQPNSGGSLVFRRDDLVFSNSKSSGTIPFDAIRHIAIEHSNKGLLRGTKGMMASFAPQGIGQMYSLFRPGAETLTIFYIDHDRALHGAVLLLPKDRKNDVIEAFARVGLNPGALPHFANAPTDRPEARAALAENANEVRVALPVSQAPDMPQAYVAAIYEELVAQLGKGKTFARVWRDGDDRANLTSPELAVTIVRAKKGNAGVRGAIPVVGMIAGKTLIEADVHLTAATGATLLNARFKGSKRMPGESIGATQSLAQRVARAVEKMPAMGDHDAGSKVAAR